MTRIGVASSSCPYCTTGDTDLVRKLLQACDELGAPRQGVYDIVELRDTQDMEPFPTLREPKDDERALPILASEGLDAMRCKPFRSLWRPLTFAVPGRLSPELGLAGLVCSAGSTSSSGRRDAIVVRDGSTIEGPNPGGGEAVIGGAEEKQ